ncbi:hypothetical protein GJAV_G00133600 [Gymnothorax javanicus]|nr:hypothetical protein GJAV_G00133600 [Gymnothorax javanicus]
MKYITDALPYRKRPHLIILRGLPGSKKTDLAWEIMKNYGYTGVILSTDDYFIDEDGGYHFNFRELKQAHKWNQDRAKEAICKRVHPIIIDNTNMRFRDMRPYVEMGRYDYYVTFRTTPATFSCSIDELHRRANCGIPKWVMYRMWKNYRRARSIYHVLHGTDG